MQHCQPWQFTGHGDWQAFTVFRHLEPALCLALSSQSWTACWTGYMLFCFCSFLLAFLSQTTTSFSFVFFLSLSFFLNTGGCRLDWFLVDRWWMCVRSGNGPVSYTILFVCVCATLTTECGLKVKLYFNTALHYEWKYYKSATLWKRPAMKCWFKCAVHVCMHARMKEWWWMLHSIT